MADPNNTDPDHANSEDTDPSKRAVVPYASPDTPPPRAAPRRSWPLCCNRCGSTDLEAGKLQGLSFRPDRIKFMTLKTGASVSATACLKCGAVELTTDVAELLKLF